MFTLSRKSILVGLSAAIVIVASGALIFQRNIARAEPIAPIEQSRIAGIAVSGHDPVAYFTEGKPVIGREDITLRHEGVEWRFSTAVNRERFRSDPARYTPQFGGYCSWAVSQGYTAPADPTAWAVRDGKLYLNYDHSIQREWEKEASANIVKGHANWPGILARK